MKDKLEDLAGREERVKAGGGEKRVRQQHDAGKLTARERIDALFDAGTFQELDMLVEHRTTGFNLGEVSIPADGVVTGFGRVNGRTVCV
ncbi:MAG: carboxyl transferase domain-containing protein, partial [Dehalococcoidales bacterium]